MTFPSNRIDQQPLHLVDSESFRTVISHFASGVAIITTRQDETDYGLTASAVCSLSLTPPMLLVCLKKTASTQQAIHLSGVFAVHILHEAQSEVALHIATGRPDKFAGLSVSYGVLGVPLLGDALATLECRVTEEVAGGTHAVFLAEVYQAQVSEGMPLTYFRGRTGRFTFTNADTETALWKAMQWESLV